MGQPHSSRLLTFVVSLVTCMVAGWCGASAADDFADQLPRIAPLEPAEALKSFKLLPGFRMELVAAEPDVVDPVAMCFDERGRLFVAEMRGYSEDREKKLGRIRLLEDKDNDGRFEASTVFADGLLWPTAVFWVQGRLLVADAPDILFLEETDGDDRADKREVVLTGFGTSNVQGLLNSFQWSLDNRILSSSSSNGGEVAPPFAAGSEPQGKVNLRGRDFAIDPDRMSLEPLTGGGQHGLTFNDWGDRFVCSNSDHLQQIVIEDRYLARNPYHAVPGARVSIAADGPQADVFRTSPVEPWRELRTKLRVSGKVPGPVERGGLASGYFTSATGVTVYRGNGWPEEFRGQVFVADVGSNLIHRKRLVEDGILYRGERIDEKTEFLTSTDNWFRPVQMANAPDGCLYICDMYREVIEHPASLPPDIKKHLDLSSRGRGRIWRIAHETTERPEPPKFDTKSAVHLLKMLEHENGWHRDTAARLLHGRTFASFEEPIPALSPEGKSSVAKIHLLWATRERDPQFAIQLLKDPDPHVRRNAVLALEHLIDDIGPANRLVRGSVYELADDEDVRVRFQVALSLGDFVGGAERTRAMVRLIEGDPENEQLRTALLTSLRNGAADVYARLAESKLLDTAKAKPWVEALVAQLDRQPHSEGHDQIERNNFLITVARLTRMAEKDQNAAAYVQMTLEAASPKLARAIHEATQGKSHQILRQGVAAALLIAPVSTVSTEKRVAAIERLRFSDWTEARPVLNELLAPTEPLEIQTAALATISTFGGRSAVEDIAGRFPAMSPMLKARAADVLCGSNLSMGILLDEIEGRRIAAADLSPAHWKLLVDHRDFEIHHRAAKLFEAIRPADRKSVVEEYRDSLSLAGSAERGKQIFTKQCSTCHKVDGVGHEIGPSLAAMKQRGAEAILVNVLDPNREVNPQFVGYAVQTTDGRALSGLIAAESATSITLKRAEGATDTVLRIDIEQLKSTGQSLMPEGLEKQIDRQAMADLLAYLLQ